MVGLSSIFSGYMRTQPTFMDQEEGEGFERDEDGKRDSNGGMGMKGSIVVDLNAEFKPIAHPPEPKEDRPIKCPVPDTSLLKEDEGVWKELFAEASRLRAEPFVIKEVSTEQAPLRVDRKKNEAIRKDYFKSSSFRVPRNKLFQVFQQCKECDF